MERRHMTSKATSSRTCGTTQPQTMLAKLPCTGRTKSPAHRRLAKRGISSVVRADAFQHPRSVPMAMSPSCCGARVQSLDKGTACICAVHMRCSPGGVPGDAACKQSLLMAQRSGDIRMCVSVQLLRFFEHRVCVHSQVSLCSYRVERGLGVVCLRGEGDFAVVRPGLSAGASLTSLGAPVRPKIFSGKKTAADHTAVQ
eukprot:CAMPEP_0170248542 /NCGR_PEP_ID=MMETSP0116_2-20130129/24066_1 /TAXON_ID=400756 /ORGANISM="Durinskia baltica, Strain CSIRO CS-38" /LENGTH=198 /DNA_ID=CAMNT_0010499435 /DNA_START=223 /DNA_END=815 /DNA_ORIENTATION=+